MAVSLRLFLVPRVDVRCLAFLDRYGWNVSRKMRLEFVAFCPFGSHDTAFVALQMPAGRSPDHDNGHLCIDLHDSRFTRPSQRQ